MRLSLPIAHGESLTGMPRPMAFRFAREVLEGADVGGFDGASLVCQEWAGKFPLTRPGSGWKKSISRMAKGLAESTPTWSIFAKEGNTKLPFVTFSTLPIFTCPGAGECASWCYSLKAWRMPEPLIRQLGNTLLMRLRPDLIEKEFLSLPKDIIFRLYVDGDFASEEEVAFWMRLIRARPDILAYGYSKSWEELFSFQNNGGEWPTNYVLNLSGGGRPQEVSKEEMFSLPITRGEFIAVHAHFRVKGQKGNLGFACYQHKGYHAKVRAEARKLGHTKPFSCAGKCGSCTPKGPACARQDLRGVVVANGIH